MVLQEGSVLVTRKNEWILAINDPSLLVIARRFNQLIQKINGVPGEISQTTAKAAISLQLDRQATDKRSIRRNYQAWQWQSGLINPMLRRKKKCSYMFRKSSLRLCKS